MLKHGKSCVSAKFVREWYWSDRSGLLKGTRVRIHVGTVRLERLRGNEEKLTPKDPVSSGPGSPTNIVGKSQPPCDPYHFFTLRKIAAISWVVKSIK